MQPKKLGADIADADRSERASDEADAHMFAAFGETGRGFARQPVLDHELAGQRQNERDDRNRDRPAHAVRRDDERDPRLRAGLDVDRVVADAEAGDDGEPAVGMDAVLREAVREKDQRVEIRKLVGLHRIARLEIGKLDIRRLTQRLEVEVGIDGRSVGLAEIAGQSDAKRRAHRLLPRLLRLLRRARSLRAICRSRP